MDSIFETLTKLAGQGDALRALSGQLGTDERSTGSAVGSALPVLLGALSRNASKPEGAAALLGALDRDHDGSVLDDVIGLLSKGGGNTGQGILRHVLGGKQDAVAKELGNQTGLDTAKIISLLTTLAPLVMGALGKAKRDRGLDTGGLNDLLGGERRRAEAAAGSGFSGLGRLLDMDGDGRIDPHVKSAGMGFLKRLFSRS